MIIGIAFCVLVFGLGYLVYEIRHKRSLRLNIQSSLEQTFLDIATVLNAHDVPFFLDFGTLLGYHRDHCIMPHEYDVDLGLSWEHVPSLKKALVHLPDGYYLKKPRNGDFGKWPGYSVKICHKRRKGNLDIYIYYPFKAHTLCQGKACQFNNGTVVDCIPKEGFGEVETGLIFPLISATLTVHGKPVPCAIPNQTDPYLTRLYGHHPQCDMRGIFGNRLFIRRFWWKYKG